MKIEKVLRQKGKTPAVAGAFSASSMRKKENADFLPAAVELYKAVKRGKTNRKSSSKRRGF